MICANLNCRKEIQVTEKYFLLALDIPYMNLYFHPECVTHDIEELAEIVKEQNEGQGNKGSRVRRGGARF